jgi:hypothetical protein
VCFRACTAEQSDRGLERRLLGVILDLWLNSDHRSKITARKSFVHMSIPDPRFVVSGYPDSTGKWRDGKRAWVRLAAWQRTEPAGDSALDALADVGRLRRVLDQVEMGAVRVARRHGKSWTEIATIMGVTRQSAWERWRDLDEPASQREPASAREMPTEVIERATRACLTDLGAFGR